MRQFSGFEKSVIRGLAAFRDGVGVAQVNLFVMQTLSGIGIKMEKKDNTFYYEDGSIWGPLTINKAIEVFLIIDYLDKNQYVKLCDAGYRIQKAKEEGNINGTVSFTVSYPQGTETYNFIEQYWNKVIFVSYSLKELVDNDFKTTDYKMLENQQANSEKQIKLMWVTLIASIILQIISVIVSFLK